MAETVINSTNVLFKRGPQANLAKFLRPGGTGAIDGCFYLTTDTNRLYIGKGGQAVPVNQGVNIVTKLSQLLASDSVFAGDPAGSFYYAEEENILCVKNGDGQFVQINPDNNTETRIVEVTTDVSIDETNTDVLNISTILHQGFFDIASGTRLDVTLDDENNEVPNPNFNVAGFKKEITLNYQIDKATLLEILDLNVDLDLVKEETAVGDQVTTKAVLKTIGTGSNEDEDNRSLVKFVAGEGIGLDINDSANEITITNTKQSTAYTLSSEKNLTNEVKVQLSAVGQETSTVFFEDDQADEVGSIIVSSDKDGRIKVAHEKYTTKELNETKYGQADGKVIVDGVFTALTAIDSENGHIKGYHTETYKIPDDKFISRVNLTDEGVIQLGYSTSSADTYELSLNTRTPFKGADDLNGGGSTGVFLMGQELDTYTQSEIDAKIKAATQAINSMTYKGTLGENEKVKGTYADLPTENVSIGDTYKVVVVGEYAGQIADIGDLFIATAKEDKTEEDSGFLAKENILWTYVPSGDDADTQYRLNTLVQEVKVDDNGNKKTFASIALENIINPDDGLSKVYLSDDDDEIEISSKTDTVAQGDISSIRIAHKTHTTTVENTEITEPLVSGGTITVVSGLDTANGHVDVIKTKTFTLPTESGHDIEANSYSLKGETGDEIVEAGACINFNTTKGETLVNTDSIYLVEGKDIDIAVTNDNDVDKIIIEHSTIAFGDSDGRYSEVAGSFVEKNKKDTFTAITDISHDNGHITNFELTTYEVPDADIYEYSGTTTQTPGENKVTVTTKLEKMSGADLGDVDTFTNSYISETLQLEAATINENVNTISINLVWGTF